MSTDINISKPIQLTLNVMEIEEIRYPSFRTELNCIIPHPTGFYNYKASDIWFDCQTWDTFISQLTILSEKSTGESILEDMSKHFVLHVSNNDNEYNISVKCYKPNTGQGEVNLEFTSNIHIELIQLLYKEFISLPRWWHI